MKPTDQRQTRLSGRALPDKAHVLPRSIKPLPHDAQQCLGIATDSQHILTAFRGDLRHAWSPRIVNVYDRGAVFRQHPLEQPRFRVEIVLERVVVIEMILRDVGERRRRLERTRLRRGHGWLGETIGTVVASDE